MMWPNGGDGLSWLWMGGGGVLFVGAVIFACGLGDPGFLRSDSVRRLRHGYAP